MFVVLLVQVRAPLRLGKPPGRPCACGPASGLKDRPFKPEPWTTAAWRAWRSCTGRSPWTRRTWRRRWRGTNPRATCRSAPYPKYPYRHRPRRPSLRDLSLSANTVQVFICFKFIKIFNFLCPDRFQLKLQQINSLFTLQFPKKFDKYLSNQLTLPTIIHFKCFNRFWTMFWFRFNF